MVRVVRAGLIQAGMAMIQVPAVNRRERCIGGGALRSGQPGNKELG